MKDSLQKVAGKIAFFSIEGYRTSQLAPVHRGVMIAQQLHQKLQMQE